MTSPSGRRGAAAVPMPPFAKTPPRRARAKAASADAALAKAAPTTEPGDPGAVFAAFTRTLERLVAPPRAPRRGAAR